VYAPFADLLVPVWPSSSNIIGIYSILLAFERLIGLLLQHNHIVNKQQKEKLEILRIKEKTRK